MINICMKDFNINFQNNNNKNPSNYNPNNNLENKLNLIVKREYDNKFDRHGFVRGSAKQRALPIKEKLQTVVELEAMLDKSQPAWTDFHKRPSNDCLLSSEACYIR